MATLKIQADAVQAEDFLPGLDNGYVIEVVENDGYLTYPGAQGAMPEDTVIITYHDSQGEECYLLLPPETMLTVERR